VNRSEPDGTRFDEVNSMTTEKTDASNRRRPLRLWPAVMLVTVQWLVWLVMPLVVTDAAGIGVMGAAAAGMALAVWWLFFSRAPWLERVGAIVLMVAAVFVTRRAVHESIANGMMGMMLPIYSIPVLSLALVAWAVASRRLSNGARRASMVAAVVLACAAFTLVRTGGVSGEGQSELHWRWTPTPEQRLLAETGDMPATLPPAPPATLAVVTPVSPAGEAPAARPSITKHPPAVDEVPTADWPGFRGPARDAVVPGVRIATDWAQSPPLELWRRPIGPGWSSFAVRGDLVYTQEQRGDDELVTCYSLATGQPAWSHRDAARFWESNGGAGPRATPTLSGGRVFTLGGTGILNALDAGSGALVWSRNAASDTGAETPGWGFAGSPLVVGDMVVVATSGRLVAYDAATGDRRWLGPEGGAGYSSPHLATIDGVAQILLLRGSRSTSVAPADGTLLWEHVAQPGVSILQPAFAADGDLLIAGGDAMGGTGLRRMAIARGPDGWTVTERWTSRGLKPYFNDFVVHEGHAFGFDGSILASIDLTDGERTWKGGRYGHGQMIVLPEQDLLLVLSEEGELALVAAAPDQYREIARFKAIDGKTWNHPVLVGDVLLVRNGEEMAAFRLPLAAAPGD
jgi:outer membrane protein assembly factor BamB